MLSLLIEDSLNSKLLMCPHKCVRYAQAILKKRMSVRQFVLNTIQLLQRRI